MLSLLKLSSYFLYGALLCGAISTVFYAAYTLGALRFRPAYVRTPSGQTFTTGVTAIAGNGMSDLAGIMATYLQRSAMIFLVGAVVARAVVAERGPYGNMYEFALAFGLAVNIAFYLLSRLYPAKALGTITMVTSTLILLYAVTRPAGEKSVDGLIPALQSKWIAIHVPLAMLSYGFFALGFAAGAMYLIQAQVRSRRLPSLDVLDEIGYRATVVGFPLLFATIILGGVWAAEAWGGFWTWDPKETSALVTWLIYAFYIHARVVRGWRGTGTALILIGGFAATVFTFFGNYFFTGLHSFIGPGGMGGS